MKTEFGTMKPIARIILDSGTTRNMIYHGDNGWRLEK